MCRKRRAMVVHYWLGSLSKTVSQTALLKRRIDQFSMQRKHHSDKRYLSCLAVFFEVDSALFNELARKGQGPDCSPVDSKLSFLFGRQIAVHRFARYHHRRIWTQQRSCVVRRSSSVTRFDTDNTILFIAVVLI